MKSVSGGSSGIDSQVEHLSTTATSRIEETKRRLVVELFVRRGDFWDMVCGLRHKYGIHPRVGLPHDESTMPLLPEDGPRHHPTSSVVDTKHPERREQIKQHNRRAYEFDHDWFGDLDRIVHERVPRELRKSPGSSTNVLGLPAGSSRLSNEYGFWVRFVSICVLYDPPETALVEFADFARARPYRVSATGGENMTIAMQTPPVANLADPADERELVMSEVNLILDEINRRYLQPRGLDINDMWRDALRSNPKIATRIWYKEELLQRRLYIEVDESTTDQDVRAA